MAVAIVAAQIMHPLLVLCIRFLNLGVPSIIVCFIDIELDVFMSLTKGEIVYRDSVRPCKVINHSISLANASVTNAWQNPRYARQWCPSNT